MACSQVWSLASLKILPALFFKKEQMILASAPPGHPFLAPKGAWLRDCKGCWWECTLRFWQQLEIKERQRNPVCNRLPTQASYHHLSALQGPCVWKHCVLITICLLAACSVAKQSVFPVLTRSGSLVPYFPYTAYVKLRTRKQDGLVLFYGLLLTRQREHATSETPRSFPLLPREPGWAPLSFGEYPREHNQAKQVRV